MGLNEIRERPRPLWRMFLDQFTDFMILVFDRGPRSFPGSSASRPMRSPSSSSSCSTGVIGFVQEYRAERAVAALKLLAASMAAGPGGAATGCTSPP